MTTFAYSTESATLIRSGVLILPMFAGPAPGPGVRETGLADTYAAARLTGAPGQNLLVTRRGGDGFAADAVLLVGSGSKPELTVASMRRLLGRVAPTARRFATVSTTFPQALGSRHAAEAVGAAAEGLGLGAYRFTRYRTKPDEDASLDSVTVLGVEKWDTKAARSALRRADVTIDAVSWARDLVNTPAGDLPPSGIADAAKAMAAEVGLVCKIWNERELERGGFGGILGVGRGSVNPPRLIELAYSGAGKQRPIALTGKGIAFDSGGLSIKESKGMESMKDDMGGAASIMATMKAIAQLKPKINVIAAIPSSENMPSGSAQKPGDVIRHYGGRTSEVLNTDAEGRLVMADALAYLSEHDPQLIIDTATLTGACVVALGTDISGAFGNDATLVREVVSAGAAVGDLIWELPLHRDYRRLIDSSVADMKNTGDRYGGAIAAALFLAEFVGDTPWVHLDIAGPAFSDKGHDLGPKGATGAPVRALIRFVLDHAAGGPTR